MAIPFVAVEEHVAVRPMATAPAAAAEAPAVDASPLPMAIAEAAEALDPFTPEALLPPMAMAPWAVACGPAVAFVPPPMAIAWVPVLAVARSPTATESAVEAMLFRPMAQAPVPPDAAELFPRATPPATVLLEVSPMAIPLVAFEVLPMAILDAPEDDAPAAEADPLPMAILDVDDARGPLTPEASDAPMAMAPWAVACGAAVVFVPPPIAIASAPVVAWAALPMAIPCVELAVVFCPIATELVADPVAPTPMAMELCDCALLARPIANASVPDADAPAPPVNVPDPMAMELCPDDLGPFACENPEAEMGVAPMTMAPWPVAWGANAAVAPFPMAIASPAVALALLPMTSARSAVAIARKPMRVCIGCPPFDAAWRSSGSALPERAGLMSNLRPTPRRKRTRPSVPR
jgi:hypothetical protein